MSLTISKPYLAGKNPITLILDGNWVCVSREGNQYSTAAALVAAGDHHAGDYGFGAKGGEVLIRTTTSTGAAGSPVGFRLDSLVTPTTADQADDWVDGSGQQLDDLGPFRVLWLKGTSTDRAKCLIRY
jgi:hypothetical protein